MKKALSIILAVLLIATTIPFAFAADESEYEARIDYLYIEPEYFTSLEAAIDEAENEMNAGVVVTVLKDLEFEGYSADDRIDIKGGEFTIDLAGNSLKSVAGLFYISDATVTFTDSAGTGVVDGGGDVAVQMYNSYINICGGTFKGQTVFNNDSSTLVIDGENVRVENYEKNTGRYSVAIKSSGTTTIKNGTFVCVRN